MQIKANGISLEVEDHGPSNGTPLILIRGQGSQLVHWPDELVQGFVDEGYRTIVFDNRDVGLSQRCPALEAPGNADAVLKMIGSGGDLPRPYGIEDMEADVIGLMDAMGLEAAHFFGISMGGAILQQLCIDHPDRILSATIVMTACRPFVDRTSGDRAAMLVLAESLLVRPRSLEEYQDAQVEEHANWGSPGYPMPEEDIRAMATKAYARGVDDEGMNRQVLAIAGAPDRRPALRQVSLPCLVVHGTDDTLIPLELGQEIAAHIPESEFQAIKGMGHIITPSLSPVIVRMVQEFIQRRA